MNQNEIEKFMVNRIDAKLNEGLKKMFGLVIKRFDAQL